MAPTAAHKSDHRPFRVWLMPPYSYHQTENIFLEYAFAGRAGAFPQGKKPMVVEFRKGVSALRESVAKGPDDAQKNLAMRLSPFSETIAKRAVTGETETKRIERFRRDYFMGETRRV